MDPTRGDLLRRRLDIPDDAERVLVFTESSHWDPDWLLTSEGYYRLRVRRNLLQAIRALQAEPRRVYGVECAFFLRMFYEREPAHAEAVRELVNEGRLRLMGSGVTSPDTLIPSTENLLRDYLLGQVWLRQEGMHQEPDVAYFPDSFGHSPGLPTILRAAGVDAVAICRIDGMFFLGCESELGGRFPLKGTTAEHLLEVERSLDFVWRGPDGAEVLCHWCAFGYGQGELLAHSGATRVAGAPLAVPNRSDGHIAGRIARYVRQLAPVSRTRYLLCPIGFDFSAPIPGLVGLLDRYNERHYPRTGTWVLNAGLDDYLHLVADERDKLPVLAADPNPYFMGFLASRPTLKRRAAELSVELVGAELDACRPGAAVGPAEAARRLERAWWTATVSNHHDYITGTAPDRVARREQLPWLADALASARQVRAQLHPAAPTPEKSAAQVGPAPSLTRTGDLVVVDTPSLHLEVDESRGGTVTVALRTADGRHLVAEGGASTDVAVYRDSGGLWRMGHEFTGGRFDLLGRARDQRIAVRAVLGDGGTLELVSWCSIGGCRIERRLVVPATGVELRLRVEVVAGDDRCVTVTTDLPGESEWIVTDVPGGVVRRNARRQFDPMFWGAQSFAVVADGGAEPAALLFDLPVAVALRDGERRSTLEVIAARNATRERAFGFVRLPGMPATGHDPGPHRLETVLATLPRHDGSDDPWADAAAACRRRGARTLAGIRMSALRCAPIAPKSSSWQRRRRTAVTASSSASRPTTQRSTRAGSASTAPRSREHDGATRVSATFPPLISTSALTVRSPSRLSGHLTSVRLTGAGLAGAYEEGAAT